MQLTLNEANAQTLHAVLNDFLPGLRRETARTRLASRELRHEMYLRQDRCERLVANLELFLASPKASAGSPAIA